MKILCVIDNLGSGGAQRQLVEIALGFHELGHQLHFLTYHSESFYSLSLENKGISIKCIISKNYIKRFFEMRYHIRQGNYIAVISFLEASNFICELAGFPFKKWKLIVGERSANPNLFKSPKLRIYRWFHLLADYVVANSYSNIQIVKSLNPLLSALKCSVIYNIVDFSQWKPTTDYVPRRNGKLKLVVASSHQKLKNLSGLLGAIVLLSEQEKSLLEIEWFGDRLNEPYFDNSLIEGRLLIKRYALEGIISFYPATKDLNYKFQQADVIGLFSFYEGLPNTVCEAMACAKPVICSAVSDIPNFFNYDKNLLFNPCATESIRNTLSYVISLSNEQLIAIGQINLKKAKENFSGNLIINKYLNLIKL